MPTYDGLVVAVRDKPFRRYIRKLIKAGYDMKEPLTAIAGVIQSFIDEQFDKSTNPWGDPWEPLKELRKDGSSKVLVDKSTLVNSFTTEGSEGSLLEIGKNSILIGSALEYAASHNYGDEDDERELPQRQIVPEDKLPDAWRDEITETLLEHFNFKVA